MPSLELETAIDLARRAGETILQHYRDGFEAEEKLGVDNFYEPVTIADRDASRLIVDALSAAFPMDAILSEEEPDDPSVRLSKKRAWIIDPIDGTSGFVKRDGDFGVQIGLADAGRPVLGVVFLPFHDILTFAESGKGAYIVEKGGEPQRAAVSLKADFGEMSAAVTRNHISPRMGRIIEHFGFANVVRRGSVGLKVGLIADRTCDIYIHPSPRTKIWDTCAPQIILEEAGGRLTDLFGESIRYDTADVQNHNGILAVNAAAFEMAVDHLKPLLREFGRSPHAAGRARMPE